MKKYKRRRFLLFVGQLSTVVFAGTLSQCSRNKKEPQDKEENMIDLKSMTLQLLEEGKEITLKWNCGGDEAIISTFIDGKEVNYRNAYAEQLDVYLINYLNLPDVGEIDVEGEGKLMAEKGEVYIEYESILKGFMDYGERGERAEWVESNSVEDMWSGRKELFNEE